MGTKLKLLLGAVLALAGMHAYAQHPPVNVVNLGAGFQLTVGCHETKLRTVVAVITWKADRNADNSIRVELTVFKDGFEKGLFASHDTSAGGAKFVPSPQLSRNAPNVARAFDLVAGPVRLDDRSGLQTLQIERLEPGLLYSFRVAKSAADPKFTNAVTVEAPVCVADFKEGR